MNDCDKFAFKLILPCVWLVDILYVHK